MAERISAQQLLDTQQILDDVLAIAARTARCADGVSLRAIAAGLEERGIPAARGGKWSAVQVSRLLEAATIPFEGNGVAAVA
jgi:hypothetical protein